MDFHQVHPGVSRKWHTLQRFIKPNQQSYALPTRFNQGQVCILKCFLPVYLPPTCDQAHLVQLGQKTKTCLGDREHVLPCISSSLQCNFGSYRSWQVRRKRKESHRLRVNSPFSLELLFGVACTGKVNVGVLCEAAWICMNSELAT